MKNIIKKSDIKELVDKDLNIIKKDAPDVSPNNVSKTNTTTDEIVKTSRQPHSPNKDMIDGSNSLGFAKEGEEKGKDDDSDIKEHSGLLEKLSKIEHDQWMKWSKTIAKEEDISDERIERWKKDWVPYSKLDDETKEFDREWARKVIEVFKEFKNYKSLSEVKEIIEVIVKKPEEIDLVKKKSEDVSKENKKEEIVKKGSINKIVEEEGLFKGKWSENKKENK